MRTVSRAALAVALALVAPAVSYAQAAAHPSFAGSWTFDPAQSDQGQMVPTKLTLTITQSPKEIVVVRAQTTQMGESNATLKYALDGTTSVNQITMGGNPVQISTVVSWEGATPVFTNSLKMGDTDIHQVDKWTLADGGKKLLVARSFSFGGEEQSFKLTLVKQP